MRHSLVLFVCCAALAWWVPQSAQACPGCGPGGGGTFDCTESQTFACLNYHGGVTTFDENGACACEIATWVPRQVVNAQDGDVGIVPLDNRGDATVGVVTREIGQFHRHAVMFHDNGRQTRHNTMLLENTRMEPSPGAIRLRPNELENGLPGAITQTIDATYNSGRLSSSGLILKPAMSLGIVGGQFVTYEPNRPRFEAAVADALTTEGYYKLSDYSNQDSMSRPYDTTRQGDQGGSHCSGYAAEFYRDQGLPIADVSYPQSLRQRVAQTLFAETRSACRDKFGRFTPILGALTGQWKVCRDIAHQVTNCFADLGCGDTSATWQSGVGGGSAVSPDNLLPSEFRYRGTATYNWDGTTLAAGTGLVDVLFGTPTDHPGLSGAEPGVSATTQTPFERAEAMEFSGGYFNYSLIVL